MSMEGSRGIAFCLFLRSPALTNWLITTGTVKPPTPLADFARLEFLYGLLWAKEDSPHDVVIRYFEFPSFNTDSDTDTNQRGRRNMWAAEKLSLSGISSGAQPWLHACLPCEASELLVRGAYREMYISLLQLRKTGRTALDAWPIHLSSRFLDTEPSIAVESRNYFLCPACPENAR